jgi:hypothetical protein
MFGSACRILSAVLAASSCNKEIIVAVVFDIGFLMFLALIQLIGKIVC